MSIREIHLHVEALRANYSYEGVRVAIRPTVKTLDILTDRVEVTPTKFEQLLKRPTA